MTDIFIPSYHRPENLKTVKYFLNIGYVAENIHVFVDSEADDIELYRSVLEPLGVNLYVFDMKEARRRYDYVHRASVSRRSAGQARNMFMDYAKEKGIPFCHTCGKTADEWKQNTSSNKETISYAVCDKE